MFRECGLVGGTYRTPQQDIRKQRSSFANEARLTGMEGQLTGTHVHIITADQLEIYMHA